MTQTLQQPKQHRRAHLQGLIFDVDGTLAETEEVHRECFNTVFKNAGLQDHWTQARYGELLRVTGGKERMRAHFNTSCFDISDKTIASFHQAKNSCYAERMQHCPPPLRPGVASLISSAKQQGLKLGIATTTSRTNLEALMSAHFGKDWESDFSAVVCGEMVQHKKPHPEAYTLALEQMQLHANEAIAFEDSEAGVSAARDAGIAVIATPSLYFKQVDFSHSDLCIDHLGLGLDSLSPPLGIPQLVDWFYHLQNTHAGSVN